MTRFANMNAAELSVTAEAIIARVVAAGMAHAVAITSHNPAAEKITAACLEQSVVIALDKFTGTSVEEQQAEVVRRLDISAQSIAIKLDQGLRA